RRRLPPVAKRRARQEGRLRSLADPGPSANLSKGTPMADPVRDLWPEDVTDTDVLPPVAIMRQQAGLLGRKTQNLVQAEVTTKAAPKGQIRHFFTLVAPALDHYRYRLFYVKHGELAYPVDIYCDTIEGHEEDGYWVSPESPERFIADLETLL